MSCHLINVQNIHPKVSNSNLNPFSLPVPVLTGERRVDYPSTFLDCGDCDDGWSVGSKAKVQRKRTVMLHMTPTP